MVTPCALRYGALLCLLLQSAASAQDPDLRRPQAPAPANLAYVEGTVDVVHDGVTERADPPMLLLDGDIVRTGNGRAEIVFADGTLLHLDHSDGTRNAGARASAPRLSGRVIAARVGRGQRPVRRRYTRVRTRAHGRARRIRHRGRSRRRGLEVSVARGAAEIDDGSQRVIVRGGRDGDVGGAGARPLIQSFNSARWDAFAQWANERSERLRGSHSAAQLPYELRRLRPSSIKYGRWDYVAPYGYVWYPVGRRGVASLLRRLVGATRATAGPGTAAIDGPGRHITTAAGASTAALVLDSGERLGPGVGQLGVCAWLRELVAARVGRTAGDRLLGRPRSSGVRADYSPWRGWTVVPRDQFGSAAAGPRACDRRRTAGRGARRAMILQQHGPRHRSVRRAAARRVPHRRAATGVATSPHRSTGQPSAVRRTCAQRRQRRLAHRGVHPAPDPSAPRAWHRPRRAPAFDGDRSTAVPGDRARADTRTAATTTPTAAARVRADRSSARAAAWPRTSCRDSGRATADAPRTARRRVAAPPIARPRGGEPSTQDASGGADNRGGSVSAAPTCAAARKAVARGRRLAAAAAARRPLGRTGAGARPPAAAPSGGASSRQRRSAALARRVPPSVRGRQRRRRRNAVRTDTHA